MSASAKRVRARGLCASLIAAVYATACLFPAEPSGPREVVAVRLSSDRVALTGAGDTVRLSALGFDRNGHVVAGASFLWRSGSECVATVDNGLVAAWGGGATAITVTPTTGGAADTATVSVTHAPPLQIAFTSPRGIEALCDGRPGRTVLIENGSDYDDNGSGYHSSQPAWSPDGTRFAFIRNCDVYTARADGSDLRELNAVGNAVECDGSPSWSPDGAKIAFARGDFHFPGPNYSTIYVANADGSGLTRVLSPAYDVYYGHPTWSPDGTKLVLHDGVGSILVVKVDGRGGMNVIHDGAIHIGADPAWSPDGSEIVFVENYADPVSIHGTIWSMNPDGSGTTELTSSARMMSRPAWSPDGSRLVFKGSNGVQRGDLYVINRDGTGLQRLTSTPEDEYSPAWRPTGPTHASEASR